MSAALARRVNQKLYQARLLLEAAFQPEDELNQVAWQQACYEAALAALDASLRAFARELAAAYRLPVEAVEGLQDLQGLADLRHQTLPELQRLEAALQDHTSPLGYLKPALAALELPPEAREDAEERWHQAAARSIEQQIPVLNLDQSDPETLRLHQAKQMQAELHRLIQALREQLVEF